MSREIESIGSNATMSPTLGLSSPTWLIRPIVPTIPASAIATMPRRTLPTPLICCRLPALRISLAVPEASSPRNDYCRRWFIFDEVMAAKDIRNYPY